MKRAAWTYLIALIALLIGALLTHNAPDSAAELEGVTLFGEDEELVQLNYTSEARDLEVIWRSDERGRYLWATSTSREEVEVEEEPVESPGDEPAESVDGEELPKAEPETTIETTVRAFKGGESLESLIDSLTPFVARRSLPMEGPPSDYGLDEPSGELVLTSSSGTRSFTIGGTAYRTRDRYLLDRDNDRLMLVDGGLLRPLSRGGRSLQDRSLLGVDPEELVGLIVTDANRERLELQHRNRHDNRSAYWAREEDRGPAAPIQDWLAKLLREIAGDYVQQGESPDGLAPLLKVDALDEDGESLSLQFFITNVDGEPATFAQSTHTRTLVKVEAERLLNLVEDFGVVLDLAPADEAPPAPEE